MKATIRRIKSKHLCLIGLMSALLFFIGSGVVAAQPGTSVLAKVNLTGMLTELNLPIYAHLQGADGKDYALVFASIAELEAVAAEVEILDRAPATDKTEYAIALERLAGARLQATHTFRVLHDDGRRLIVRLPAAQSEALAMLGFELARLPRQPMVIAAPKSLAVPEARFELAPDPLVTDMINQVSQSTVNTYTGNLSGEWPVDIGGSGYTITTRHTNSGTPIDKATQYVYEFMQSKGIAVSYHNWSASWYSGRNVVGEKTGTVSPNEVVLVTAHLDCMPSSGSAPGADDNGSGSTGLMVAAEILSQYNFEKTVRFVFFTGEEQGLYGSKAYANLVSGENITAVYNMDMIAWDDVGGPVLRLHTRTTSNPGYSGDKAIADLFVDVVNDYGLGSYLTPVIDPDGITASDHSSFWNKGFAGILAIEDDEDDFCAYYHTSNDLLSTLNMTYFTNYVKASVGTAALLAIPASGSGVVASFTYLAGGDTVDFTDTSTSASGTINNWTWNFGDGTPASALQDPTHTYATENIYTVTLTVEDSVGASDSVQSDIVIDVTAPGTPTGLNASNVGSTSCDLIWNPATDNIGVAGYNVYQDGALIAQGVAAPAYTVTGLAGDTTYVFTVESVDRAGNLSNQSAGLSVTTTKSGCGAATLTRDDIPATQSMERAVLPLIPMLLVFMVTAVIRKKRKP